jgi:putative spermidine/putrescine transport system permease protein
MSRALRGRGWLLCVLPAVLFLLLGLVLPLLGAVFRSFQTYTAPTLSDPTRLTLENYGKFFADSYYLTALWRTFGISLVVAGLTVLLGYPAALFIAMQPARRQSPLLLLFVTPLLVSIVVRTYGWTVILGPRGVLNSLLQSIGLISAPLPLIRNELGVVIGLTHVLLAYLIFPLYAALVSIDPNLGLAARNLGASPFKTFLNVTLPLSFPAVMAGASLVFTLSMASWIVPTLLGGTRIPVVATMAYDQTVNFLNWPFGSAIGMILLAVSLSSIYVAHRSAGRWGDPHAP